MLEQEELRLDVRPRPPCGALQPGPSDLDPPVLRRMRHVPRRSLRRTGDADGEGDVARRERLVEIAVEVARPGHEPEDLEPGLGCGTQPLPMLLGERLDGHDPADQRTLWTELHHDSM